MANLVADLIPFETARQLEAGDRIPPFALTAQDGTLFNSHSDEVAGLPTLLIFDCGPDGEGTGFESGLAALNDQITKTGSHDSVVCAITRGIETGNRDLQERLGLTFDLLSDPQGRVYRACGLEPAPPGCDAVVFVLDPQFRVVRITAGRGAAQIAEVHNSLTRLMEDSEPQTHQTHAPMLVIKNALTREDCARLIDVWHQPVPVWKTDGLLCDGHEA
ncbi:peroxiredoxin family protein [Denitrobaculum tricleocarpae]|uniref:Redoxin domain-containing protein n=1 Tax=Denitrobaculum tricleocarpae TaxID=2591009 RepID=A0A545TPA9_9PROT|nr:redoxin domain-containing protein [Denitrobaculum tricleocarpae]TQV79059.1 redoxin domain-containing protein [Denitrobaculum tricleocarpae]